AEERIGGPWHGGGRRGEQRRRAPVLGIAAFEPFTSFLGAGKIARRVTRAAVREALDEVRAAIPLGALPLIGDEASGIEVEPFPYAKQRTDAGGKDQPVRRRARRHRLPRHDERVERAD